MLDAIVAHYTVLDSIKADLGRAYRSYVVNKASPGIVPITISQDQEHALGLAYTSRPEAAGLKWIDGINYNALLSCPFCGGDGARTIEHYLPQASYPEFSVFSLNLMPSCGDCNRKRNDANKHGAEIKLLHPYFDWHLLDKLDLYTSIDFMSGVPRFELEYDREELDDEQQERIDHHIKINVDWISFINKTLAELEVLKVEAEKYSGVDDFLRRCVDDKVYLYDRVGAVNSWGQALCKGILKLTEVEVACVFGCYFGKR
ncbi:hypothetical protein QN400_07215 [Pseudomonas sp. RTC3]|uniref:hypothetical protein n=1 Tax=Pseudomonas sp. 5C2 TaxID=3048588 RepID=UPI002AB573E6|nr:hypothetical protein [Pseudomonas sp. 5C2]MDY7566842.1 hypothetical protein [Pseudomonas sp. 5C2]MEB0061810.1 hypothetical protein [Pseudomonas sp. RTC3]MEB0239719.1 hypothetical protein [Pseudomonas sp. 5C2]